jgi:hypothetical protein
VSPANRKNKTRQWKEIYSAKPWFTPDIGDSDEDMIVSIWTPRGADPRARKVLHRGGSGRRYKFSSHKVGRMVHCESPLEYDLCHLLEIILECETFCEQPVEIHYQLDGEYHIHIPDQLAQLGDGRPLLLECKYRKQAEHFDVASRSELMSRCLPKIGLGYRLVTEDEIQRQPRLQNAEDIRYYGRRPIEIETREQILKLVNTGTPVTWGGAITGQLGERGRDHLCRLVREGALWFDIEQQLLPDTRFVRKTKDLVWSI